MLTAHFLVIVAKLALAAAFAIAGAAKLADRRGFGDTVSKFGIPSILAAPVAALVPALELAIAGLLLPARFSHFGAAIALLLLSVFTIVIAANLARGRRPDCRCFGQLQASPIGWTTVARNVALAICAVLVLSAPSPRMDAGLALSLFINGLQLFLLFELFRRHGRLLLRLDRVEAGNKIPEAGSTAGLPIGTPAPVLDALKQDADLPAAPSSILLLFTEADCAPCRALWPEIPKWERASAGSLSVIVIAAGPRRVNTALAREYGVRHSFVQHEHEIADRYHVTATPSGVLVDAEGRIASGVALGRVEIEDLL